MDQHILLHFDLHAYRHSIPDLDRYVQLLAHLHADTYLDGHFDILVHPVMDLDAYVDVDRHLDGDPDLHTDFYVVSVVNTHPYGFPDIVGNGNSNGYAHEYKHADSVVDKHEYLDAYAYSDGVKHGDADGNTFGKRDILLDAHVDVDRHSDGDRDPDPDDHQHRDRHVDGHTDLHGDPLVHANSHVDPDNYTYAVGHSDGNLHRFGDTVADIVVYAIVHADLDRHPVLDMVSVVNTHPYGFPDIVSNDHIDGYAYEYKNADTDGNTFDKSDNLTDFDRHADRYGHT